MTYTLKIEHIHSEQRWTLAEKTWEEALDLFDSIIETIEDGDCGLRINRDNATYYIPRKILDECKVTLQQG